MLALTCRFELGNQVCIMDVLGDHRFDSASVPWLGLNEQNRFRFLRDFPFSAICAGDRKAIRANRQALLQQCMTDPMRLVSCIERHVVNSHFGFRV